MGVGNSSGLGQGAANRTIGTQRGGERETLDFLGKGHTGSGKW